MLDFKDFKAMISVTDGVNDRDFDPLAIDPERLLVTDGRTLFVYKFSTGSSEKIGVSREDYLSLRKVKGKNVYFNGGLRIDDTEYKKSEKFFAFDSADRLLEGQKEKNRYKMPFSSLPENKCELVLINQYNILYLAKDLSVLSSQPLELPEMESTPLGYFCARNVYLRKIFKMFKYFKVQPEIRFGSNTLYFESPTIQGLLGMYVPWSFDNKDWKYVKGE